MPVVLGIIIGKEMRILLVIDDSECSADVVETVVESILACRQWSLSIAAPVRPELHSRHDTLELAQSLTASGSKASVQHRVF